MGRLSSRNIKNVKKFSRKKFISDFDVDFKSTKQMPHEPPTYFSRKTYQDESEQ